MSENSEVYRVQVEGLDPFQYAKDDKPLLKHIEDQGIEVHYHCREGYCGACRTKLIQGEVEYITDPLAFIDDDEILPCCCKPTSDIHIQLY